MSAAVAPTKKAVRPRRWLRLSDETGIEPAKRKAYHDDHPDRAHPELFLQPLPSPEPRLCEPAEARSIRHRPLLLRP